jgi:Flp pilus assembly protein TadB
VSGEGPVQMRPQRPRRAASQEIASAGRNLHRRAEAARVRSRRLLLGDAALALAVVLLALIAGTGVGLLGLIALVVLVGFGIAVAVGRFRRRRRGGDGSPVARRQARRRTG